jgi:predicted ribosomally synthesized peptide with SipW-like signal peptide
MTDDNKLYRLSRRKALAGLGSVGLASAGAGLGTSAYLNDTESFENNTITAGTLDLLVGYYSYWDQGMAGSGSVQGTQDGSGTVSAELGDVKPGDNGLLAFCPVVETNPAYLWLCGEITSNSENGYTEPEPETSENGDVNDPGDSDGAGELAESISVTVNYCDVADEVGDSFEPDDVSVLAEVWTGSLAELMSSVQNGVPLDGDGEAASGGGFDVPGEQACFAGTDAAELDNPCLCLDWEVQTSVGNEIQGDSLEFDLEFHAEQCRNNDGTHNPCAGDGDVDCESCDLPTDVSDASEIQVSSIDASSFPDVSMFLRVDTTAGNNGDLTAEDFEVCENGLAQDESVNFTSGSAADIVFVFDDTGSMGEEIEGAQAAITNFVDNVTSSGIDARFALVSYKDTVQLDEDFTSTQSEIESAIDGLTASGGGDGREDNFDALGVATRDIAADDPSGAMLSSFRSGAQRVIIDITDAPAQVDDPDAYENDASRTDYVMSEVETLLDGFTYVAASNDLSEGGFFTDPRYEDGDKEILANNVGGTWFELPESDSDEFSDLLTEKVSGLLTTTYTVSYTSCDDDGEPAERDILLEIDDPEEGTLYEEGSYTVPS